MFQVAAADPNPDDGADSTAPESDTPDESTREIRIKRLRPADPESTEVMLAGLDLDYPDRLQA